MVEQFRVMYRQHFGDGVWRVATTIKPFAARSQRDADAKLYQKTKSLGMTSISFKAEKAATEQEQK